MILRSLLALAIGAVLLSWSAIRLRHFSRLGSTLQAIGAIGVIGVGIAHLCEALRVFPIMGWGAPHSVGHYLDLASALAAVGLLPLGFVLSRRRISA